MNNLKNNSDLLIERLVHHGVKHFFILSGGNAMFLNEAVRKSGVAYTAFHHEQAAAMAAEAYSRTTGELSVCLVTSGPGVSNLVTGVAGSYLDSVPVFFIAGQAKSIELVSTEMTPGVRQYGTFELPGIELLRPVVKLAHQLKGSENPIVAVDSMVALALDGRPGPVYLEVPLDVQSSLPGRDEYVPTMVSSPTNSSELKSFVRSFLADIAGSRAPLVIAGNGVIASQQIQNFCQLIDDLGIPVVTTQIAKQILAYDSDKFVGHLGIRGDRPGNLAVYSSDCILVIGCSLQQQTIGYVPHEFAPNAKVYLIDFEKSISLKKPLIDIHASFDCSVSEFIEACNEEIGRFDFSKSDKHWQEYLLKLKESLAVKREPHDITTSEINLYEFVDVLSNVSETGDCIITDAGLSFYVMGQAFKIKSGQNYVVSGGLGSMGYALPAAIGASLASHKGKVIAVTGDGSLQMNVQELATLKALGRDVLIYVINNEGYASIRNSQKSFFGPNLIGSSSESGVQMPSWELMAAAYGVAYAKVLHRENLESEIIEHRSIVGPALIEVVCQPDQKIMPMIASIKTLEGTMVSNPLHKMSPLNEFDENLPQFN